MKSKGKVFTAINVIVRVNMVAAPVGMFHR